MKTRTMGSSMKNRQYLKAAACGVALFGLLVGCSEEKKEGKEKGMVEQASDKVAAKAVEQIQQPINKAKDSQALQNAQNQNMQDMNEQTRQ
jgi:hypothetical protein